MENDPERLSATLAWLAIPDHGVRIHFNCRKHVAVQMDDGFWSELHMLRHHYGWTVSATDALARWGPETTLADLERRATCRVCGARRPLVGVQVSSPVNASSVRDEIERRNAR